MRYLPRLVAVLALGAALSACPSSSRFVKPVAASVGQDGEQPDSTKYEDGYLRVFVSSNLDTNGRALDFGRES